MLNNLNSERIMEAREIYHVLKSIVEPIHAHSDQMVAIAKWIEAEFEYKPQKQANGVDQSASNCNIPHVIGSAYDIPHDAHVEAYKLHRGGNKIGAVKHIRTYTNTLKEAVEYCRAHYR